MDFHGKGVDCCNNDVLVWKQFYFGQKGSIFQNLSSMFWEKKMGTGTIVELCGKFCFACAPWRRWNVWEQMREGAGVNKPGPASLWIQLRFVVVTAGSLAVS